MTAVQLALLPKPDAAAPATYWEHTGRPREWRPVTVTCRYGPGRGEPVPPFPLAVTGRTAPRNVAIRRADGTSDVLPVRTLRRKDPYPMTATTPRPDADVVLHLVDRVARRSILPAEIRQLRHGVAALAAERDRYAAAIDSVRKLHHPARDWSWQSIGCPHDGEHARLCASCRTCWPCPTASALPADQTTEEP